MSSDAPVVITGAAGRVGSVLVRAFAAAGRRVVAADLQRPAELPEGVRFAESDVTDPEAMKQACEGAGALVHLAGHPNSRDWSVLEHLNIRGARVAFEAAAEAGASRVLYASSIHTVGLHPAATALTADLAPAPSSPYGLSKLYGEELLKYLCLERGLTGFAVRICSFRPEPANVRELRTWLSPADTVRLFEACLTATVGGYHTVWGVSANRRAEVDRETWARIGYVPQDDAEAYAERLRAAGADLDRVSDHPRLGAHFVSPEVEARLSADHGDEG